MSADSTVIRIVTARSGRRVRVVADDTASQSIEDAAEQRHAAKHRCRRRSDEPHGLVACRACGGRRNLTAYYCDKFDTLCVELRRPVDTDVRWCFTCKKRE